MHFHLKKKMLSNKIFQLTNSMNVLKRFFGLTVNVIIQWHTQSKYTILCVCSRVIIPMLRMSQKTFDSFILICVSSSRVFSQRLSDVNHISCLGWAIVLCSGSITKIWTRGEKKNMNLDGLARDRPIEYSSLVFVSDCVTARFVCVDCVSVCVRFRPSKFVPGPDHRHSTDYTDCSVIVNTQNVPCRAAWNVDSKLTVIISDTYAIEFTMFVQWSVSIRLLCLLVVRSLLF